MVAMRILIALMVAMTLTSCGKKADAPTRTAEQEKIEKDAATKAVRDNAVYGNQFKTLDKARDTAAAATEAAQKTEDALKKAEDGK